MAASSQKKRSSARKQATKAGASSKQSKGFWRALAVSALASFTASSCALKLPWFEHIEEYAQLLQDPSQWLGQLPWVNRHEPSAGGVSANTNSTDFAQCRHFFPKNALPVVQSLSAPSYALCFDSFAILYNAETKTPIYVVERLNKASLQAAKGIARGNRFYPEARLPSSARAQLEDYRGSGYSRGHMAPAGDMPSNEAMAQSFSLANMVPQNQSHNGGPWSKIEGDTRQYAARAQGDVYVFTGPVYADAKPKRIGPSAVAVPSHLFKLVYDPNTQRSWAHWHQNKAGEQSMTPISHRELTQRTRIEFLPN